MTGARNALALAGQLFFEALGGKLGVPMMVLGYLCFALVLLAYVSTQVYTHSLMEGVAARKRSEMALRERVGVLTARYATMTSKSRVSAACEKDLGLVESTTRDVVRVAFCGAEPAARTDAGTVRRAGAPASEAAELTRVKR
jgi:hypothetical protein